MKKYNGFTMKSNITAKCAAGHTYEIQLTNYILPIEEIDENQFNAIKLNLQIAHKQLKQHECEFCIKSKLTGWR